MPTYEYECDGCGISFERFQKMSDEPIRTCPECEGTVRRLISPGGGLVFKGPGFYATDYRKGSAATGSGTSPSDSRGSEKESSGGETSSDGGHGQD